MSARPFPLYHRIVFCDVDGTLIDASRRLPLAWPSIRDGLSDDLLVLTSSRTVDELIGIQRMADIDGPFIAENGAVLAFPFEFLESGRGTVRTVDGRLLRIIPIGTPASQLTSIVKGAAAASGVIIETPHDADVTDVPPVSPGYGRVTPLALGRTHSLVLRISGAAHNRLGFSSAIARAGLMMSSGGHWDVVQGESSKGAAVRAFLRFMQPRIVDGARLIGVGNAANDRSLLEAVDERYVMRASDGSVDPALKQLAPVHIANRPGVDGWEDVMAHLQRSNTGGLARA